MQQQPAVAAGCCATETRTKGVRLCADITILRGFPSERRTSTAQIFPSKYVTRRLSSIFSLHALSHATARRPSAPRSQTGTRRLRLRRKTSFKTPQPTVSQQGLLKCLQHIMAANQRTDLKCCSSKEQTGNGTLTNSQPEHQLSTVAAARQHPRLTVGKAGSKSPNCGRDTTRKTLVKTLQLQRPPIFERPPSQFGGLFFSPVVVCLHRLLDA